MRTRSALLCLLLGGMPGQAALAFEPMRGQFLAKADCPATAGIKRTVPDGSTVQAGSSYAAEGLNKAGGDYVQVRIPGARPELRWVPRNCGELVAGGDAVPEAAFPANLRSGRDNPPKYRLAISWQPAFCEAHPRETECRIGGPGRFDADHFTLHGLWPQPENNAYCGVPERDRAADARHGWDVLPEPRMSPETRIRLQTAMPGTASNLQRHEWIKHGVCFGTDAEGYFRTALALLDQINRSKLRDFVAGRIGDTVAVYQLKAEFERSFGPGTGAALAVRCSDGSGRRMVGEIWISLTGTLSETTPLANVLDTSVPARSSCDRAVVDRAGPD